MSEYTVLFSSRRVMCRNNEEQTLTYVVVDVFKWLIHCDVFTTGVSALDMCLSNCTWSGDRTVELYPWDAGTDDGITYMVCC